VTESAHQTVARPLVAAGALFFDEAGRVLLVRPTYKPMWDIPGGYLMPGESPLAACVREVREELAFAVTDLRYLVVDWAPADDEGDKILFIFDGGTVRTEQATSPSPDGNEIAQLRYTEIEELDEYVPARLARRIRAAVAAKTTGQAAYAEHGAVRAT